MNMVALAPVRFAGADYAFAGSRIGHTRRVCRLLANHDRRRDFRWRQIELAVGSLPWLALGLFAQAWGLALFVLIVTVARDEALRFRATGQRFQTRRALWVGATPHDRAHRHLLNGWTP